MTQPHTQIKPGTARRLGLRAAPLPVLHIDLPATREQAAVLRERCRREVSNRIYAIVDGKPAFIRRIERLVQP